MKKISIITLSLSMLVLVGCNKSLQIEEGDKVTINYTGTFENGDLFEKSKKTITIGSGDTIKGIEESLIGKKAGKTFNITITPEQGYGHQYSLYNQQRVSALIFEKLGLSTEIGAIIQLDKITGKVLKHEKDKQGNTIIIFDINPIQTRQNLSYEITIENIEKDTQEYTL